MTRADLEKMKIKPWEIGYEMAKQLGEIVSYETVSFTDEDENGIRHIEMKFVPNQIISVFTTEFILNTNLLP